MSLVSAENITLAGQHGREILNDIQQISAGSMSLDDASPEISRGPDGMLRIKVSNDTIALLSGNAEIAEDSSLK